MTAIFAKKCHVVSESLSVCLSLSLYSSLSFPLLSSYPLSLHLSPFYSSPLSSSHLAEHRVLRAARLVEPVEEAVVHRVDEELRPTGVGCTRVGH